MLSKTSWRWGVCCGKTGLRDALRSPLIHNFLGSDILARRFSAALLLFEESLDLEVTIQGRRPASGHALAASVAMVFLFAVCANDQHTFGARRREESLVLQREINHKFGHSTHQHQDKSGKPSQMAQAGPA